MDQVTYTRKVLEYIKEHCLQWEWDYNFIYTDDKDIERYYTVNLGHLVFRLYNRNSFTKLVITLDFDEMDILVLENGQQWLLIEIWDLSRPEMC